MEQNDRQPNATLDTADGGSDGSVASEPSQVANLSDTPPPLAGAAGTNGNGDNSPSPTTDALNEHDRSVLGREQGDEEAGASFRFL
jgi:hypothetical protein